MIHDNSDTTLPSFTCTVETMASTCNSTTDNSSNNNVAMTTSELLYFWATTYSLECLVVLTLIAITVFRREMSCNHCYAEDEEDDDANCSITATTKSSSTNASRSSSTSSNQNSTKQQQQQQPLKTEESSLAASLGVDLDAWDDDEQVEAVFEGLEGQLVYPCRILFRVASSLYERLYSFLVHGSIAMWWKSETVRSAEELLDAAGNFCSGQPLLYYPMIPPPNIILVRQSTSMSLENDQEEEEEQQQHEEIPTVFTSTLPSDLTVHVLSFLHPKDIVCGFGCTSRACHRFVNDTEQQSSSYSSSSSSSTDESNQVAASTPAEHLWKTLYRRDYAWIVDSWKVGHEAKQRSLSTTITTTTTIQYNKEFYFRFAACYMNYVLAGHNRMDDCLVGIQGHVYDLSPFLHLHPGSPETILAHAGGRDATDYFESMRHTVRARRLAQQLCILVDVSKVGQQEGTGGASASFGCGLRPTQQLLQSNDAVVGTSSSSKLPQTVNPVMPPMAANRTFVGNHHSLDMIWNDYTHEQAEAHGRANQKYQSDALGEVHVYYDPFQAQWNAWYTDKVTFEAEFVTIDS